MSGSPRPGDVVHVYILCTYHVYIMCISYVCVCRGLAAGIYATNNPEACHFVADNCKANVIVVENQKQLDKILEVNVAVTETYFCTSQVECRDLPMSVCLHHYQCHVCL